MATIERTNLNGNGDQSYYLKIRYTKADAKTALQRYVKKNSVLAKNPMKQDDFVELFCNHPLGYLPRRNAGPLALWLFNMAVKSKYIEPIPTDYIYNEKEFIIAPNIMNKRPGPQTKE